MNELRYCCEGLGGGQGVFPAKIFFGIPAKPFSLSRQANCAVLAVHTEFEIPATVKPCLPVDHLVAAGEQRR
jgi:hypothetical protein